MLLTQSQTNRPRSLALATLITCLLTLLSSCGSTPTKTGDAGERSWDKDTISALLKDAESSNGVERTELMLTAVQAMLQLGERDWAHNSLDSINPATLNDEHYFTYSLLAAHIASQDGRYFVAKGLLWNSRFARLLQNAAPEKQVEALFSRADTLENIAEFHSAVQQRLRLDALLESTAPQSEERELNQDSLWQVLMRQPYSELLREAERAGDTITQGWYTLAALSKNNQTNMRQQLQSVENWALNWPDHPASLRLPADLQLLKQLVEHQPQNVAVLLPLSGKYAQASQAVRDGLMAAYYNLSGQGEAMPVMQFYDTEINDINLVYDHAVTSGADLVIGPLDKARIDELALRPSLPVPTLALNYVENPAGGTEQLFQFGLAVEDEARQVAERAWLDGHRSVMILAPNNQWGDRNSSAFTQTWQELGGHLVGNYRYETQKEYSNLIRQAMDISDSQERAREMRQILGQTIEFEPRPRADIDLIFLVAHSTQARQLKPILAFHYAGDIPVYATSYVYDGNADDNADRDMNGIRFTTLPWFFSTDLAEKQAIEQASNDANSYQRLYALGVDAFHIYPRLKQLESVSQSHFYGSTGVIRLDTERRVVREQTWAQFVRGRAYPTTAAITVDKPAAEQ